ncbi:GlsB/YeaQ/YmgE family stress response membrane protein [Paenibacillus nasutitermitis]|uniref:Membrane protein n=1 Tax=Paenibacillus nasutitermitis TaxID=1652958 RepID=A0A916YR27_9BACL|nr:GlsB/YeaQ/YmgE family stress response membrane protein [Paenibacillus nasutitermitis]GGD57433.1 membrane protein [Paenibacillus nasutitermitis]
MELLWYLIVGGVIGWLAGLIAGKDIPGGVIGNIIAGILGAWLGGELLGDWGPKASNFYILPALLGAIMLVLVLGAIVRSRR